MSRNMKINPLHLVESLRIASRGWLLPNDARAKVAEALARMSLPTVAKQHNSSQKLRQQFRDLRLLLFL